MEAGGTPLIAFSSSPVISGGRLTLTAVITNRPDIVPDAIQVWETREPPEEGAECSTERPVAFLRPGPGGDTAFIPEHTPYTWDYCYDGYHYALTDRVPWLDATTWELTMRPWRDSRKPKYFDFTVSVNLAGALSGWGADSEGTIIMIWDGPTLLSKVWLPPI